MRLLRKIREGPETDPDGLMLVVGQENHCRESSAERQRDPKQRWRPAPGPWAGSRHKNRVGECVRMAEQQEQQAAVETPAVVDATTAAPAAEAGKDYSFDRDVWVTGERFTASMTPEAFAKFVKALDESK